MAAVTIHVGANDVSLLGAGQKMVKGGFVLNTYNTSSGGGTTANLANYFASDSYPVVMCGSANGVVWESNRGTANVVGLVGRYILMQIATQSNASYNATMVEVGEGTSISQCNIQFVAIGKAF